MNTGLNGISPNHQTILAVLCSLRRNVDNQINLMAQNKIQNIRRLLLNLTDFQSLDPMGVKGSCGSPSGKDLKAYCSKSAGNFHCLLLLIVANSHDHILIFGQTDPCSLKGLVKSLIKGLGNA